MCFWDKIQSNFAKIPKLKKLDELALTEKISLKVKSHPEKNYSDFLTQNHKGQKIDGIWIAKLVLL